MNNSNFLDDTDYQILEILKQDGRCSYSDIAKQVHLSRVAVRDRVNNLVHKGIIRGFTVIVDAKAYNHRASLFLDLEVVPNMIERVAADLAEIEEVAIISQHTGISGLHVHVFLEDTQKLSQFLSEQIYSISGVKSVECHVLLKQYKTNSYITGE